MLEKSSSCPANKTDAKTEFGITSFMTMAYILAVNRVSCLLPVWITELSLLLPHWQLLIGTLAMALFANYPFALAPGMGLNAYFAYTVVARYGIQLAVCSGCCICRRYHLHRSVLTNVREAIFSDPAESEICSQRWYRSVYRIYRSAERTCRHRRFHTASAVLCRWLQWR